MKNSDLIGKRHSPLWAPGPLVFALATILGTGGVLRGDEAASQPQKQEPPDYRVRIEVWDVPALEVARRSDALDGGWLDTLRQDCLGGKLPDARLVSSPVLALANKEKTKAMVSIYREATFAEEVPDMTGLGSRPEPGSAQEAEMLRREAVAFTCPSTFFTRNTGIDFIVEVATPPESDDMKRTVSIDFSSTVERGKHSWGDASMMAAMPDFIVGKVHASLTLNASQWRLISSITPPSDKEGDDKPQEAMRRVILARLDFEEP